MIWRDLFTELRRRRVYRVCAAYVIVAFALLQGASAADTRTLAGRGGPDRGRVAADASLLVKA